MLFPLFISIFITALPHGSSFNPSTSKWYYSNFQLGLKLHHQKDSELYLSNKKPLTTIIGYVPQEEKVELEHVLVSAGFDYLPSIENIDQNARVYSYKYIKASGMLKLVEHGDELNTNDGAPKWIPVQSGEEVSILGFVE